MLCGDAIILKEKIAGLVRFYLKGEIDSAYEYKKVLLSLATPSISFNAFYCNYHLLQNTFPSTRFTSSFTGAR